MNSKHKIAYFFPFRFCYVIKYYGKGWFNLYKYPALIKRESKCAFDSRSVSSAACVWTGNKFVCNEFNALNEMATSKDLLFCFDLQCADVLFIVVNVHLFYRYGWINAVIENETLCAVVHHFMPFTLPPRQTNEQDFEHTSGISAKSWMFEITIESIIIVAVHFTFDRLSPENVVRPSATVPNYHRKVARNLGYCSTHDKRCSCSFLTRFPSVYWFSVPLFWLSTHVVIVWERHHSRTCHNCKRRR